MMTSPSKIQQRYAGGSERPLGSFLALMATYGAVVTGVGVAMRARGVGLPQRVGWRDLGLLSVATFKLSRLLAKDPVSSPLRAPFTKFEGQSGEAEVAEEVVGDGPRKAIGELVTCPFCIGQWVGTGLFFCWLINPRLTRVAASVLTTVAAADVLQFGYDKLQSS
jgi:hypothetical protein